MKGTSQTGRSSRFRFLHGIVRGTTQGVEHVHVHPSGQ